MNSAAAHKLLVSSTKTSAAAAANQILSPTITTHTNFLVFAVVCVCAAVSMSSLYIYFTEPKSNKKVAFFREVQTDSAFLNFEEETTAVEV